jgi:hypothetical protein
LPCLHVARGISLGNLTVFHTIDRKSPRVFRLYHSLLSNGLSRSQQSELAAFLRQHRNARYRRVINRWNTRNDPHVISINQLRDKGRLFRGPRTQTTIGRQPLAGRPPQLTGTPVAPYVLLFLPKKSSARSGVVSSVTYLNRLMYVLSKACSPLELNVLVKPHPHDTNQPWLTLLKGFSQLLPNVTVTSPYSKYERIIEDASIVVSTTSSAGFESLFYYRKLLIISNYIPYVPPNSRAFWACDHLDEVPDLLKRVFAAPTPYKEISCILFALHKLSSPLYTIEDELARLEDYMETGQNNDNLTKASLTRLNEEFGFLIDATN